VADPLILNFPIIKLLLIFPNFPQGAKGEPGQPGMPAPIPPRALPGMDPKATMTLIQGPPGPPGQPGTKGEKVNKLLTILKFKHSQGFVKIKKYFWETFLPDKCYENDLNLLPNIYRERL
jgi:hypothetical protein